MAAYGVHANKLFSSLGNYLDVFQENDLFKKFEHCERTHHETTISKEKKRYQLTLLLEKKRYLLEIFHEFEEHIQQLNTDLVDTTKENERDMLDQRNKQFSTILIAGTIMITALIAALIQGKIAGATEFLTTTFAVANGASVAFLFLSTVLCVEVIWRAFKFMNTTSKKQTAHIEISVKKAKQIVRDIRDFQSACPLNSRQSFKDESEEEEEVGHAGGGDAPPRVRRRGKEGVSTRFKRHEQKIFELYKARENIIDETAALVGATNNIWGRYTKNFEKFWKDHCAIFGKLAVWCFYLGSASLLVSNVVFMWITWNYTYGNPLGAWISLAVLFASLLLSVYYIAYLRYFDVNRYAYKEERCAVVMAPPLSI